MRVKVYVYRSEAIKAGIETHGWLLVDVPVAELTERQREALVTLRQDEDSRGISGDALHLPGATTDQAAIAAALDELADKREAAATEEAADVEREVLRLLELPQEEFVAVWLSDYSPTREAVRDPRLAERMAQRKDYTQAEASRKREAEAEARARREAEQDAARAEDWARIQARRSQREEWVATRGTPNQQARLAANLLPVSDVEEDMAEEAFAPLGSFVLYEPMHARDVCTCGYDEACHVDFSSEQADEATATEWEVMEALRATLPGAELQLREHHGETKHCEQTVTRRGVKVTVTVEAYRFHREYKA